MFGAQDMPNRTTTIRIPAVSMTLDALMKQPTAEVHNYVSDVLPLLRMWSEYRRGFEHVLAQAPGTLYAVANFNVHKARPEWCRERINLFDMKIGRCLLGKHWSKKPDVERPHWIAVPERASFLHYNMLWEVPIASQEKFFLEAPRIWREVVPSGQFHLQVIGDGAGESTAVRAYSGKTFHPRWTIDHTITSKELRRKK